MSYQKTGGVRRNMFYLKELKETKELLKDLQQQYLKLRKEYWELLRELDEIERQDDKIEELERIIEKLSRELAYKTELLTDYHLRFGDECFQIIEKKRSRIKKRTSKKGSENDEGEEL